MPPNPADPSARPRSAVGGLRRVAENPVQVRLLSTAVLLAAWYLALYAPLAAEIDEATRRLAQERQRLTLARQIEGLRAEGQRVKGRVSEDGDRDALARHLMQSVDGLALRLKSLDPRPVVDVGPFKAATYYLVVEGPYDQVRSLLHRLESSDRLLRIDMIRLASSSRLEGSTVAGAGSDAEDQVEMRLTIMGIVG